MRAGGTRVTMVGCEGFQAECALEIPTSLAYLVLVMIVEFAKRGRTEEMRALKGRLEDTLRSRFARPVEELTLGRFLRLIAMDFPSPPRAGVLM